MWRRILIGLVVLTGLSLLADEPQPDVKKPPYERMLKGDDAKRAKMLEEKIDQLQASNQFAKAATLAEELLALRVGRQGRDHWEVRDAQNLLAELKLPLSASQIKQLDEARRLYALAGSLCDKGLFGEAVAPAERVLSISRDVLGEVHYETAKCKHNLANLYASQGAYGKAEPLYQNAIDISRRVLGENHPVMAASYDDLASNLHDQGKLAEATTLYLKALDINRRVLGQDHPNMAASYNSLGKNLNAQGKLAEAAQLFQKALDINRRMLGEEHRETAMSYNNLAFNLNSQGKLTEAATLYGKAIDIDRRVLGDDHPGTANAYNNLANNLYAQLRFEEASVLAQKALDINRRVLGEEHPRTANSYNSLAINIEAQGKAAEAAPLYERALEIYRRALGEEHFDTSNCYNNLVSNLHVQGKLVGAESLLKRAIFAYEASRLSGAMGVDRASLRRFNPRLLMAAIQQSGEPITAWGQVECSLARALLDQQARSRPDLTAADEAAWKRENARVAGAQPQILAFVMKASRSEDETARLESLLAERREAQDRLAAVAVNASTREVAPSEAIQAALATDAALVCWVDVCSGRYSSIEEHWGCVVRAKGKPNWERLPGTGPEGKWIKDDCDLPWNFRKALAATGAMQSEVDTLAHKLHAQRLGPLQKHLQGASHVYIVPAYAMAGIPVEGLTRDYTVSYIPSGTFLARLKEKPSFNGSGLLALGDPVFTGPNGKAGSGSSKEPAREAIANCRKLDETLLALRGGEWKDLPGTRVEVTQIVKLFGNQASTLVDSAASEQALEELRKKGDLTRFRFLHFATHGEANNVKAFESALILAQDTLPNDLLPRVGEPYIDGKLSAREVLEHWKLDADLVTLSACETAIGSDGGGDGMLGFAQAFLTAGARSVCLTLWKVDDTATALLMNRFYQNLLGKRPGLDKPMPKAAALAEAKNWLRELSSEEALKLTAAATGGVVRGTRGKDEPPLKLIVPAADSKEPAAKDAKPFAHPKYWSAFILIGDPN